MMKEIDLKFSSELALKRSIRLKYPHASKEQWKATYEDLKQYLKKNDKRTVEQRLADKWDLYKIENKIYESDPEPPSK